MENKEENCIFCKIIKKEIPASIIYEDDYTVAFLDVKPVNPGHTLVIPKAHHANIFETPDEIILKMMGTMKKISHALKDSLGIENVNIMMNNGKNAGQTVFHAHLHFIPRYENDGHKNLWSGKPYGEGEADKLVETIKKAL